MLSLCLVHLLLSLDKHMQHVEGAARLVNSHTKVQQPISPVIKLGIRHPRKKERKEITGTSCGVKMFRLVNKLKLSFTSIVHQSHFWAGVCIFLAEICILPIFWQNE